MSKQDKITKAARGRDCQVRLPGICNGNNETTVLAHYRLAGTCGMGIKPSNFQAAWACSSCHDAIDGRSTESLPRDLLRLYHAEACFRTTDHMIREGLIQQ